MYDKGQKNEAIEVFMKTAIGTNYKDILANILPLNSFELAVVDAQTFFHEEIPSMKSWRFTKTQTKDLVHIPVLHIRGIQKSRKIVKREKNYSILTASNCNYINIKLTLYASDN
jgi:hypothetical protein